MSQTEYVVLVLTPDGHWQQHDGCLAGSARAAVRHVAERLGDGTYVAVPLRSFRQTVARTETVKRVRVEEAEA